MNRHLFCAIFCAIAALCSISVAHAEVLVYEGFHQGDWTGITATGSQQIHKATTTGNYSTGFTAGSKWSMADGTTQISVSGTDYGLALPAIMTEKGFTTCGGAAQCNPASNNNELRGGRHDFASKTLKVSSGTLYVRALLRLTAPAAAKLSAVETPAGNKNGSYFGFGLIGSTASSRYAPTTTSNKSSCSFLMWKNSDDTLVLSLCLIDASGTLTHYPLVTGFTIDSTYICYAKIQVGAGTDSKEIVRAGAMDTSKFSGAASWAMLGGSSESVEVQLITDSAYPKSMAFAGPYGTNNGSFRADELVVGTEMGDILPVGGVFAVLASGTPSVGQDSFSTDWILVADDGVTADAGIVYSTGEAFETATTNSLGTGLSADTRTASLTNLEPATTYWWKVYADNGSAVAESVVYSFTTTGAPVLGDAAATVNGESAEFSVALEEAALGGTTPTSVSLFYCTDGETWTEQPLGSSSTATNWTQMVADLGYGVTYQWFVRATATMMGGRVLSAESVTNSFTTPYNGDMYVNAAAENATPPYSTSATAAKTIAAALALAMDGATIHVAPGLYPISKPIAVTNAIAVLGDDLDPSRVIVSNTVSSTNGSQEHRVFIIANAGALVANLTMQKGEAYNRNGGNFNIGTAGGIVSNCVVEAGYARDNGKAAGAWLDAGVVTHSVFRKNYSGSASVNWERNRAGLLQLNGQARAENCLFIENNQTKAVTLINLGGSSVMRNCTIVNSGLSVTNQDCLSWSALNIASGATVQNVVIAGVTNTVDGAACKPTGTRANFLYGALDSSIEGTSFPVDTVVGTAESFFKDYANGDYTPKTGGPLVGKGANYEGMASVDLAGKSRLVRRKVDIGCYELQSTPMIILVR